MNFHVNAHFFATQDRRSIQHDGPEGRWNDEIFVQAGRAIGKSLPAILTSHAGLRSARERLAWFWSVPGHTGPIERRATICMAEIDAAARGLPAVPDRDDVLQVGRTLCVLPREVEEVLANHVERCVREPDDGRDVDLYKRWGVPFWGRTDVISWLRRNTPSEPTSRRDAPPFVSDLASATALLVYCGDHPDAAGLGLVHATDGNVHPLASSAVYRPDDGMLTLTAGLPGPLVIDELRDTPGWARAPKTSGYWLRDQLIVARDQLAGREVGSARGGVLKNFEQVRLAMQLLADVGLPLEGTPLAVDEDKRCRVFDSSTIAGLPAGHRKSAAQLLSALGRTVLHQKLDDDDLLDKGVERLTPDVLLATLEARAQWDLESAPQLLLLTVRAMNDEAPLPSAVVDRLRNLELWPTTKGDARRLVEVFLPPRVPYRGFAPTNRSSQNDSLPVATAMSAGARCRRSCESTSTTSPRSLFKRAKRRRAIVNGSLISSRS